MRTKLLLGAVILAAGVASTMAQSNVYSLNVVGYYNIVAPQNARLFIANQLAVTPGGVNDVLSNTIPNPGELSQFFKYNNGFAAYTFDGFNWDNNGDVQPLRPGDGGFFVAAANTTLTFVGEVLQGNLTNQLRATGTRYVSAPIVPQLGLISTDHKFPAQALDQVFQYRNGYAAYTADLDFPDPDTWPPGGQPTNQVGEAFFYIKQIGNNNTNWVRNFTVQ